MKKLFKRILRLHPDKLLFIIVLLAFLLGNTIKIGTQKVTEAKAVTLVFTQWWQNELEHNALAALITEFEKAYPGVKIKLDYRSYYDMETIILNQVNDKIAAIAGAEITDPSTASLLSADILALDPRWLYGLIRNDMLEPLKSYKKTSNFIPALQPKDQETPYDDWAFPLVSFMAPLFYNIDILTEAGFDRPPKNQSDLRRYALAITNSHAQRYGIGMSLSPEEPQGVYLDIYSWVWASGTVLINQEKSPVTALAPNLTTPVPNFTAPVVINTLGFLQRLYAEGLIDPAALALTREQKLNAFINGNIGMMIASVQDIEVIRKGMKDGKFGITTIPGPDEYQGKPAFGLTNWYAGISRESKHKDLSWEFILFLAKRSPLLAAASHAVPGSGNGLEDYLKKDLFYSKAYNIYEGGDGIQEFAGYPAVHVLDFIVREEVQKMLLGQQDAKTTAEAIQRQWEGIFQNALRFGS